MSKLSKLRDQAVVRQHGKCCYCDVMLLPPGTGPLSATAEHLIPRSEGGATNVENIAAACRYCNSTRARAKRTLSPGAFRELAMTRLGKGRWHQRNKGSAPKGATSVLFGQHHREHASGDCRVTRVR
jgi:hypothetical protein